MSKVAKKKANEVAAPMSFGDYAGAGMENVTANDLLIPRLTILQGLSPQVNPHDPLYDEHAKVGDVYDVGMCEAFPEGILFLPVVYRKEWLEWAPRESGGGLIRIHATADVLKNCEINDDGKPVTADGNLIAETAEFFGLNLTADGRQSFIPMASTQLKRAKQLVTFAASEKVELARGKIATPPLFYRTYQMSSVPDKNPKGSFMSWKIERGPKLEELDNAQEIFSAATRFYEAVKSGEVRGQHDDGEPKEEMPF